MLKIYQIQYSFVARFDEDDEFSKHNGEVYENVFYLGASNIQEATYLATIYGGYDKERDSFKNGSFDIASVVELKGLDVINWPKDDGDNPFEIDGVPEDDLMEFVCTCGEKIVCKDFWSMLYCPSCNREIDRLNIIGNNGKYILVDIDNKYRKE